MKIFISFVFIYLSIISRAQVNQVVLEVGGIPYTSRYVEIDRDISDFIQKEMKIIKETNKSKNLQSKTQEFLIDYLISQEAKNLNLSSIKSDYVSQFISTHKNELNNLIHLKKYEASDKEIYEITERILISNNYLKVKLQNLASPIMDQDVQIYFEKNKNLFDGKNIDNFKENIKIFLMQQQLQERLKSWYESLKRKYKVRVVITG